VKLVNLVWPATGVMVSPYVGVEPAVPHGLMEFTPSHDAVVLMFCALAGTLKARRAAPHSNC
jgi:hypothetical protein